MGAGREKKPDDPPKGAPEFMTTYGDLVTLMLCFFVMLVALSAIDASKFKMAASSFQNALGGVLESMPTIPIHKDIMVPKLGGNEQNRHLAASTARLMNQEISKENLEDAIKVKVTDNGLAIQIADPVGFDVGDAELKPEFMIILDKIARLLNEQPENEIRVEGHTDNTPIATKKFPSNWELSSARALSVVKFLHSHVGFDPTKLSAVGYGEYRPVAPNTTTENKQKNRRIEIYVEYLKKSQAAE